MSKEEKEEAYSTQLPTPTFFFFLSLSCTAPASFISKVLYFRALRQYVIAAMRVIRINREYVKKEPLFGVLR